MNFSSAKFSIVLKSKRDRSLLRRHPWVFSGAIERVDGNPADGDTVLVRSADGDAIASGSWSSQSQIAVRIWSFDPGEEICDDFFLRRVRLAIGFRSPAAEGAGGVRLINAESDGLPGVVADMYGRFVVCQFLGAGAERWKKAVVRALEDALSPKGVYERSDADVRKKEGLEPLSGTLSGSEPPELLEIEEGPCRYLVDVKRGHKTGFYLDQAENRAAIGDFCRDREMLDCFAYTGGFAVRALKYGAARTAALESSEPSLALARKNAVLNGIDPERHEWIEGDVFAALRLFRDSRRTFDMIVLDPPKFAESSGQVAKASRGYKDINLLAFKLLRPGGILFTFSCSGHMPSDLFQKIVSDAALDAKREARIVRRMSQGADHPVALSFPEGSYLKGLVCEVA